MVIPDPLALQTSSFEGTWKQMSELTPEAFHRHLMKFDNDIVSKGHL